MKETDFTSLVQQKIEERREGRSAARQTAVGAGMTGTKLPSVPTM